MEEKNSKNSQEAKLFLSWQAVAIEIVYQVDYLQAKMKAAMRKLVRKLVLGRLQLVMGRIWKNRVRMGTG